MPKPTLNKSAFVRSLGSMPARDVVAKAKQRGIKLSIAHVYTIRSEANRKARKTAGSAPRRGRPPKAASRSTGSLHTALNRIVGQFVDEIVSAVRRASLDELVAR
jgi:hypothetical protein